MAAIFHKTLPSDNITLPLMNHNVKVTLFTFLVEIITIYVTSVNKKISQHGVMRHKRKISISDVVRL